MNICVRILLASGLAAAGPAIAAAAPVHNPELTAEINGVRDAAHAALLGLRRLDLVVAVHGEVAEVTVDAAFLNPGDTTLEGDFRLQLPQGAVVTGYALDVGATMIDGVLVDSPRAKAIYDARVRRGVDPGLAEVKSGNLFETHVHPIFPHSGRHIRLRFVVPVSAAGLALPLHVDAPTDGWSIAVSAAGAGTAPLVTLPDGRPARFARQGNAFVARAEGSGTPLDGSLVVRHPALLPAVVTHHVGGEFDVQAGGDVPAPAANTPPAKRLRIYWDRSRGRLASHIEDDIALVHQVIARTGASDIELVAFNSSGAQRLQTANVDAAVAWLTALTYRGASSYAAIAGDPPTDRCLLFAGSHPTLDLDTRFAPACRLDAVTSAPGADLAWLRHVAQAHGGTAYALMPGQGVALAASLALPYAGVVAVRDQDGRPVPFVPLDAPAGHWLVLARAPEGGPLTVAFAGGAERKVELRAQFDTAEDFDGPGALLAADRLADLTAAAQREDYVALSRRYGIASPSLSFLVLESPQDYIAAKVAPSASFPSEWRDDYLRQTKANAMQNDQRLEQLVGEWRDEVAWWKTRFAPDARPERVIASDAFDHTETNPAPPPARTGRRPAPPPPMVAPPPPIQLNMAPPPIQSVTTAPPPAIAIPAPPAPPPPGSEEIVTTAMRRTPRQETAGAAGSVPGNGAGGEDAPHIAIDAWQSDRPYLELYDGKPADFDARFLEAEARHGTLPIFYLDTAEWLRKHGRTQDAIEMVLSAIELPTANEVTLGIVAARLERYGAIDRAVELRERAARLDPDLPQPRRLLALALARRAALHPGQARADLTRAIALLYDIAVTQQAPEWQGIELIVLNEANALLPRLRALGGDAAMDPRLVALLDVDLRVVIDWTSDGSDMDLWIDEPDRERAIYNNARTAIGGRLSHDMTRGYGPEEYMLRKAPVGTYTVQANVFAPDRLDPNGATILTAHLIRDFGRPGEHEESVDVELTRDEKGAKRIGEIQVAP